MDTCIPLALLHQIANRYPDCWALMERMHNLKGVKLPDWDPLCYVPIAAGIAVVTDGDSELARLDIMGDAATVTALTPWRLHKQIYSFPEEMEVLLYEQAALEDFILPIETLKNLPFPCIYVETKKMEGVDGFFAHFESDTNDGRLEFRFLLVNEQLQTEGVPLHLIPGGTIAAGIQAFMDESIRIRFQQQAPPFDARIREIVEREFIKKASCMLQLVLYICAQNSEIEENPVQKKIYRKPKEPKYIKDKYREIRKWDCGVPTSQIIRKMSYTASYPDPDSPERKERGSGGEKRPHPRRGHWHHFWIKAEGEKKLVLKWVAPTFIHKNQLPEDMITINQVPIPPDNIQKGE